MVREGQVVGHSETVELTAPQVLSSSVDITDATPVGIRQCYTLHGLLCFFLLPLRNSSFQRIEE